MKLTKEIISEVQLRVHSHFNGMKLYNLDEDDICQEIFLRIIESLHIVDIAQICADTCNELIEKQHSSVKIVSIDTFADENRAIEISSNVYENAIVNKIVALSLLNKLRPVEKQIVEMHFGFRQPVKTDAQISDYLGISEEDLKNAIPVIIAKLKP